MQINIINNIMVLSPEEGKILTNGEIYSDQVYLGIHDASDNWWEINIEDLPEDVIL